MKAKDLIRMLQQHPDSEVSYADGEELTAWDVHFIDDLDYFLVLDSASGMKAKEVAAAGEELENRTAPAWPDILN